MDDIEIRQIKDRVAKLETDTAVIRTEQRHIITGVDNIQDNMKWLVRLVAGALVLAFIGFAVNGGLAL